MSHLNPFIKDFMPYAQKHMKFNKMPTIMYYSDQDNAAKTFGKTAYYDPSAHNIVLYVDGRHPKDIMRSLSHELVHHKQNCAGQFDNMSAVAGEQGYAQKDSHLREMEREAYELGNMVFRDWEDTRRDYLQENNYFKRSNNMSTKQWKDKELNRLLMEKWGYFKVVKNHSKRKGLNWGKYNDCEGQIIEIPAQMLRSLHWLTKKGQR